MLILRNKREVPLNDHNRNYGAAVLAGFPVFWLFYIYIIYSRIFPKLQITDFVVRYTLKPAESLTVFSPASVSWKSTVMRGGRHLL